MAHPNEELARKGYASFEKGDLDTLRNEVFAPGIQWHIPGRSSIAGDYSGIDEVFGFFGKIAQESGGTFRLEIHDVIGSDTHAVGLVTATGVRNGKSIDDKTVHVFHIENGKVVEFWGHAQDQYAVDEFWS
jgi:ketosteroid isomerase-like protein